MLASGCHSHKGCTRVRLYMVVEHKEIKRVSESDERGLGADSETRW